MAEQDIKELVAGQARLEQKLDDMHNRLFGNGQPGAIQYLNGEVKDLSKRVGSVENKQYWMSGLGAGLGMIAGLLTKKLGF